MTEIDDRDRGTVRPRGLGRGLAALLGSPDDAALAGPGGRHPPASLPIELLRPSPLQPRRHFDDEHLRALADSIRSKGVMQPLVVRPTPSAGYYEIVAGERRWRAAQLAGVHEVPVVIRELSDADALEIALIENIQRQDLGPLEEAAAYQRLMSEFGHTQDQLGRAVGKSRSHIANTLRLLSLPEPVRRLVDDGRLSAGHARALLMASDPAAIAQEVLERELNVRQTEALVKADRPRPPARPRPTPGGDADARALEREVSGRLGLPVTLKPDADGGGRMTIAYRTLDQLDDLLRRLGRDGTGVCRSDVAG